MSTQKDIEKQKQKLLRQLMYRKMPINFKMVVDDNYTKLLKKRGK
jgi:hypothetical protein